VLALLRVLTTLRRVAVAYLRRPATLRRIALVSVIGNVVIVVTGGLVRLTGSGLGCPTWPRCTNDSYVTTAAMGYHGAIEFGNRTLIFVLTAIAAVAVVVAFAQRDRGRADPPQDASARGSRPKRRSLRRRYLPGLLAAPQAHARNATFIAAVCSFGGVPAQAVLGGIVVHTGLSPWIVAAHFLVSMVLIAASYTFWRLARHLGEPSTWTAPAAVKTLAACLTAVCATVLVLGTVVTGSGPHSGADHAARTGFDPESVAQLHADGVFLLIGLSVALWFAVKAVGAPVQVVRAAGVLVLVELAQGVVGFVQYLTNLPALVVLLHMLGACTVWIAALATLAAVSSTTGTETVGPATADSAAAPSRPLAREDAEEQIVAPLPLAPRALHGVPLQAEPDTLQQSR
jgi:cytochrome c oxidase assembly protein subunit 15